MQGCGGNVFVKVHFSKVFLSKVYFCVSSKLCEFIFKLKPRELPFGDEHNARVGHHFVFLRFGWLVEVIIFTIFVMVVVSQSKQVYSRRDPGRRPEGREPRKRPTRSEG